MIEFSFLLYFLEEEKKSFNNVYNFLCVEKTNWLIGLYIVMIDIYSKIKINLKTVKNLGIFFLQCNTDVLTISSAGGPVPRLCGTNSGYHMYVGRYPGLDISNSGYHMYVGRYPGLDISNSGYHMYVGKYPRHRLDISNSGYHMYVGKYPRLDISNSGYHIYVGRYPRHRLDISNSKYHMYVGRYPRHRHDIYTTDCFS